MKKLNYRREEAKKFFMVNVIRDYINDGSLRFDFICKKYRIHWTTALKIFDCVSWKEMKKKIMSFDRSSLKQLESGSKIVSTMERDYKKNYKEKESNLYDTLFGEIKENGFVVVDDFCRKYEESRNKVISIIHEIKDIENLSIGKFKDNDDRLAYGLFDVEEEEIVIKQRDYSMRANKRGLPFYHFMFDEKHVKVLPIGDCHIQSEREEILLRRILDKCREENFYVTITGDMFEMATRYSIGSGVYHQVYNNHKQFEVVKDILAEYQDIILFVCDGNHEARAIKEIGVSLMKIICDQYKIPYAFGRVHAILETPYMSHEMITTHKTGSSAQTLDGKRKSIYKRGIEQHKGISFFVCGHLHEGLKEDERFYIETDKRTLEPVIKPWYAIMNPSIMKFFGGYADVAGLNFPSRNFYHIDLNGDDYGVGVFDFKLIIE